MQLSLGVRRHKATHEGTLSDIAEHAAFLRAAIILGLLPATAAVQWADTVIDQQTDFPIAVYDLAIVPGSDLPRIRDALGALAAGPLGAAEPERVVHALLDLIRADLFAGRTDLPEAVGLIARTGRLVLMPEALRWEIVALNEDYSLVADRIAGDWPTISTIVREWLSHFDGTSVGFRPRAA